MWFCNNFDCLHREWKEKYDLVDDEEDDTLTYHYKNTFIFRPDLSGPGLTGNEIITMPHPGLWELESFRQTITEIFIMKCAVMAGMVLAVNVDKQPMIPLVGTAINSLFHEPKDMFWSGRVMDMLFDGVPIDCSSDDFNVQAVCSVFESGDIKAVRQVDEKHYMFSIFAGVNYCFVFFFWQFTVISFSDWRIDFSGERNWFGWI